MIFSMDVLPAEKGDCLILHYGQEGELGLMVIDGGPGDVYKPHLKPRLEKLRTARAVGNDPLKIDVLMVSHIDDDHIGGILSLTKEMKELKAVKAPRPYRVLNLWHNALRDLLGAETDGLTHTVLAAYGAAALTPEADVEGLDEVAAKVLASVGQGVQLRDDAGLLAWPVNAGFDGDGLIRSAPEELDLGHHLAMTIVGPMGPEIAALQKAYQKFRKKPPKGKSKVLASFTDTSVPNLSSIVALAEVDGRTMLLTGDARGDKILKGLEKAKLLDAKNPLKVDILKVPHHGSDRNMETSFFERVLADHYVFSGNGEHGNPERETLAMLLDARPDADFKLYFTYPIAVIDAERKREWEREQAKEKKKLLKAKDPKKVKVRENWSHAAHSLAAFFEDRGLPNGKQIILEVEENGCLTIDLHKKMTL